MNYLAAKQSALAWGIECKDASLELQKFPVGANGLTPDAVKFSPEFIEAKRRFDFAFNRLRAVNAYIGKNYRKERTADRLAARALVACSLAAAP